MRLSQKDIEDLVDGQLKIMDDYINDLGNEFTPLQRVAIIKIVPRIKEQHHRDMAELAAMSARYAKRNMWTMVFLTAILLAGLLVDVLTMLEIL